MTDLKLPPGTAAVHFFLDEEAEGMRFVVVLNEDTTPGKEMSMPAKFAFITTALFHEDCVDILTTLMERMTELELPNLTRKEH